MGTAFVGALESIVCVFVLGVVEGARVCFEVGSVVGAARVGRLVTGALVGIVVGECVGARVGARVRTIGRAVGSNVAIGASVGCCTVGSRVGLRDLCFLREGCTVGSLLGTVWEVGEAVQIQAP